MDILLLYDKTNKKGRDFLARKIGSRTVELEKNIGIVSSAAVVGEKEFDGPIGKYFDIHYKDELFGKDSFEKAESKMQQLALDKAIEKLGLNPTDIDCVFAGDLLNQCIASNYALREIGLPFLGLYGACSTFALALSLSALTVESGAAFRVGAVTSSHFCTAERQYRFPLEYGSIRTPTSQWTVTGSGAAIIEQNKNAPQIHRICFGKIIDLGITDMNNMGAAMAPAAADTIEAFFKDTGTGANDYDLILTGDLGKVGSDLLIELLKKDGYDISAVHSDCGKLIYDTNSQDAHAGGSGAGCCSSVFSSFIMKRLKSRKLGNILFCATGALMSPTSNQQGETIPAIAHLVNIRY